MAGALSNTLAELARDKLEWTGEWRSDLRLVEDLELDSVRLLTLAMAVEDHFEICLDEADEAAIVTVGDLLSLIERKLAAKGASYKISDCNDLTEDEFGPT